MILLNNIKKVYNKNIVLDIKHLSLKNNNIYGLIGPNGAGKTTTIRIILGLLKPTCGSVFINNFNIHLDNKIKSKIGYVPDNPNLYEDLTGREFIEFVSNLYSYKDEEDFKNKIDYFLDLFDIKLKSNTMISEYSKGMKQKISIISALIHNPEILILDEPFTGLDPITIKKLKVFIKDFAKNNKMVIFSTHDLDVASNICTDIIILDNGKIKFNDKLENLTARSSLEDKFVEIIEKTGVNNDI
ncbi:ABC transporter ATP-binding protein [Clostridium sp. Marseille-Q2269]|uniref:ABC transporter ATP-binding protein n=1 Tax=Clostridium sp. Marseille-Q2269 TaxID=2942205 RepID=UPI002074552F|nr:ABC transporter ATP-binding protein [Clostridium sp. Marseille-Q2269]